MAKPKTRVDENGRVCTKCNVYKLWMNFDLTSNSRGPNNSRPECVDCRRKRVRNNHRRFEGGDTFDIKLKQQNGRCEICSIILCDGNDRANSAHFDHCHKTNKARGIICSECNRGLAAFKDDVKRIQNVLLYLRKYT